MASVFENVVKSFYLNVTRNLRTTMGPQLLLESSLFTRIGRNSSITLVISADGLGLTHLSLLHCDIFRECYTKGSPLEDKLKIAYRGSQIVSCHAICR